MDVEIELKLEEDKYVRAFGATVTSTQISCPEVLFLCSGTVLYTVSYAKEEVKDFKVLTQGQWPELD